MLPTTDASSTKAGISPFLTMHPTDVENVSAGVITSEPFSKLKEALLMLL